MSNKSNLNEHCGSNIVSTLFVPSQVSKRLGSMLYMMNLPLSTPTLHTTTEKPGDRSSEIGSPVNCNSEEMMASPRDPDILKSTEHLHETENNSPPSASSETAWWTDVNYTTPDGLLLSQWWFCLHDNKLDWRFAFLLFATYYLPRVHTWPSCLLNICILYIYMYIYE